MEQYNPTIGYASLSDINEEKATFTASYCKRIVEKHKGESEINKIFIAGCGDGTEAILFQKLFDKFVYGVDISLEKELDIPNKIKLCKGDLMNLNIPPESFDFIYSYHVLEHVPNPKIVLKTLYSILIDSGIVFIGFPNKNRALGYVGTHNDVSAWKKIKWNLQDYKDRIQGKFENNLGAHAGFTNKEFLKLATEAGFKTIIPVRNDYMSLKYSRYDLLIKMLISTKLNEILFPSNYYILKK
jgi:SAM-dependent methyltransferase